MKLIKAKSPSHLEKATLAPSEIAKKSAAMPAACRNEVPSGRYPLGAAARRPGTLWMDERVSGA